MQLSTTWGLDWPLNSEPVCRCGSWTPTQPIHLPGGQWIVQWLWKESLHPILPQLKVELHDDQTFLMNNCCSAYCLLSSALYLLASVNNQIHTLSDCQHLVSFAWVLKADHEICFCFLLLPFKTHANTVSQFFNCTALHAGVHNRFNKYMM